jgi:hypothetical protein
MIGELLHPLGKPPNNRSQMLGTLRIPVREPR